MSGDLLVATGYLLVEMLLVVRAILVVLLMTKQAYLLAVEAVEESS